MDEVATRKFFMVWIGLGYHGADDIRISAGGKMKGETRWWLGLMIVGRWKFMVFGVWLYRGSGFG